MNNIFGIFSKSIKTPDVRKKLLFTAGIFIVFRIFAHIPVAGVNLDALKSLFSQPRAKDLVFGEIVPERLD